MNWAQGILTLRPGVWVLVADANPIFKLHLFLGMTIFLVFPFTRLVHVWSAPVWYLGRRGYQVVRTSRPAAAIGTHVTGRPATMASHRTPGTTRPLPAE
jgi:nitrate reductase gamma subunit